MMKHKKNIFLIGPMGSGKTSVGKVLAKLLNQPFFDSDEEIQKRTGVDIPWIFEQEGESGFRKREGEIITRLTQQNSIILSTGGGAVTDPAIRMQLSKNGLIIYLRISIDKQLQRISHRREKLPMLTFYDTKEKLMQLNSVREPYYEEIAHLTYQTDNLDPDKLAKQIILDIEAIEGTHEKN